MQKFYQDSTGYIAAKLPIGVTLLKNTECLHPGVRILSESLPGISKEDIPLVRDEWKLYKEEKVPDERYSMIRENFVG